MRIIENYDEAWDWLQQHYGSIPKHDFEDIDIEDMARSGFEVSFDSNLGWEALNDWLDDGN